jgi:predicted lipid-binding transport protein (Tim44 family)
MKIWAVLVAVAVVLSSQDALAQKRLGGGFSFGKQSGNVTRNAPPAQPAQPVQSPTQSGATQNAAQRPATAPAAAPASRPWGGMLTGLAAGLGLAWLASALGLGEAFAQILLFALLAVVVLAVVGFVMRSRNGGAPQLATQGAGAGARSAPMPFDGGASQQPRAYSPQNVGNDASARPWERTQTAFDATPSSGGSLIGSALGGPQTWGIPAGFDAEGFLRASKANFVRLQDAWDRADIPALRAMMTDEMVAQIEAQLSERESHTGAAVNKTEVVMLEAQLLGIEELDGEYMASVEFSGLIREDLSAGPNPFREVWNITRPKEGQGGWLVAGVQALQ